MTIVSYVVDGIEFFSYNKAKQYADTQHTFITTRYTSKNDTFMKPTKKKN